MLCGCCARAPQHCGHSSQGCLLIHSSQGCLLIHSWGQLLGLLQLARHAAWPMTQLLCAC
jgi:hypothetical protein